MELVSCITCGMEEQYVPSSFDSIDGLTMAFGSLFLVVLMFMLWSKTPAGKRILGED